MIGCFRRSIVFVLFVLLRARLSALAFFWKCYKRLARNRWWPFLQLWWEGERKWKLQPARSQPVWNWNPWVGELEEKGIFFCGSIVHSCCLKAHLEYFTVVWDMEIYIWEFILKIKSIPNVTIILLNKAGFLYKDALVAFAFSSLGVCLQCAVHYCPTLEPAPWGNGHLLWSGNLNFHISAFKMGARVPFWIDTQYVCSPGELWILKYVYCKSICILIY